MQLLEYLEFMIMMYVSIMLHNVQSAPENNV